MALDTQTVALVATGLGIVSTAAYLVLLGIGVKRLGEIREALET